MKGWVIEGNGLNLNGEGRMDVSGEENMGKRVGFDR